MSKSQIKFMQGDFKYAPLNLNRDNKSKQKKSSSRIQWNDIFYFWIEIMIRVLIVKEAFKKIKNTEHKDDMYFLLEEVNGVYSQNYDFKKLFQIEESFFGIREREEFGNSWRRWMDEVRKKTSSLDHCYTKVCLKTKKYNFDFADNLDFPKRKSEMIKKYSDWKKINKLFIDKINYEI